MKRGDDRRPEGPHPRAALARLARGAADPADLAALLHHLATGCARCSRTLDRFLFPATPDEAGLEGAVARAAAALPAIPPFVAAERRHAESTFVRLAELPAAHRRLWASNAPGSLAVVERLIAESRRHRHEDPSATLHWAELAALVAERLTGPLAGETLAHAVAERGNARRITDDLHGAARDLALAVELAHRHVADPLQRAELASFRGSLAKDQRRFAEARSHLARAGRLYKIYGDSEGTVKVWIKLAQVEAICGDPAEGLAHALRALAFAPGGSPLRLSAYTTLLNLLLEDGQPESAHELAVRAEALFLLKGSRVDQLNLDWITARAERDLDRTREATARLERVRKGYLELESPYSAGLATLDLASLLAETKRSARLAELAAESAAVFRAAGIGREEIVALGLLASATRARAQLLIAGLRAALERTHRPLQATE